MILQWQKASFNFWLLPFSTYLFLVNAVSKYRSLSLTSQNYTHINLKIQDIIKIEL